MSVEEVWRLHEEINKISLFQPKITIHFDDCPSGLLFMNFRAYIESVLKDLKGKTIIIKNLPNE